MFGSFAEWLPECGADVLCLQEVTRTAGLEGWTRFDDGERTLPQRANLFEDVCAMLPRHQARFVASDAGPVYDGEGRAHRQDFGLATFVTEQLAIVGQASSFVHGSFVEHDVWAIADRPRRALAVRLFDAADRRVVTVAHLHGLRDPHGKGDTPARRAQAERVLSLVSEISSPGDLTVVCGDLNVLPDSETFSVLRGIGLVDLVGSSETRTSRYPKEIRHANYMLVSNPEAVKRFEILQSPEVSDHRPLVLDL